MREGESRKQIVGPQLPGDLKGKNFSTENSLGTLSEFSLALAVTSSTNLTPKKNSSFSSANSPSLSQSLPSTIRLCQPRTRQKRSLSNIRSSSSKPIQQQQSCVTKSTSSAPAAMHLCSLCRRRSYAAADGQKAARRSS